MRTISTNTKRFRYGIYLNHMQSCTALYGLIRLYTAFSVATRDHLVISGFFEGILGVEVGQASLPGNSGCKLYPRSYLYTACALYGFIRLYTALYGFIQLYTALYGFQWM
jgi:hypothetical protein